MIKILLGKIESLIQATSAVPEYLKASKISKEKKIGNFTDLLLGSQNTSHFTKSKAPETAREVNQQIGRRQTIFQSSKQKKSLVRGVIKKMRHDNHLSAFARAFQGKTTKGNNSKFFSSVLTELGKGMFKSDEGSDDEDYEDTEPINPVKSPRKVQVLTPKYQAMKPERFMSPLTRNPKSRADLASNATKMPSVKSPLMSPTTKYTQKRKQSVKSIARITSPLATLEAEDVHPLEKLEESKELNECERDDLEEDDSEGDHELENVVKKQLEITAKLKEIMSKTQKLAFKEIDARNDRFVPYSPKGNNRGK